MIIKKTISILLVITILSTLFISTIPVASAFELSSQCETGCIPESRTPDISTPVPEYSGDLLSSVDLSESQSFPCVRSQSSIKSCSAWATTYYQFGYQVAAMNGWNAKTNSNYQFSPKYIFNLNNNGMNTGISQESAYKTLNLLGAVSYSSFSPSGSNSSSEYRAWCTDTNAMYEALKYRVSEYTLKKFSNNNINTPIFNPNAECLDDMKSLLCNGYVLTIETYFSSLDYDYLPTQNNLSFSGQLVCIKNKGSNGLHAMAVVGYDDDIWYDYNEDGLKQSNEKGAFKLVNSHGTNYGNSGYIWVMYDALNKVSNFSSQNVTNRHPVFNNYYYNFIEVSSYPVDLVAEVTLVQSARNQIDLDLGISELSSTNPLYNNTFMSNIGNAYNFNGVWGVSSNATFVFDYFELFQLPSIRKAFYLSVTDSQGGSDTTVNKVEFIDKSGHTVAADTNSEGLSGNSKVYRYRIGLLGDVDNSGTVEITDSTKISRYLVGLEPLLSTEDLAVADTDGDGSVSIIDATNIQRYLADIIDYLPGGFLVDLN